ncbi:MAG: hemerythrin domain-containing protein [Gammaproteobacteria bacterium]
MGVDLVTVLSDEHMALSQMFARHQEALVMRSWARAARLLDHYRKRLQHRILLEERYLLPYCVDEKLPGQWQVYISEHRRLENTLNNAHIRLTAARRRGITAVALIALLDEEKTLKHILEHHLQREEAAFSTILRQSLPMDVSTSVVHALMHPAKMKNWPIALSP